MLVRFLTIGELQHMLGRIVGLLVRDQEAWSLAAVLESGEFLGVLRRL